MLKRTEEITINHIFLHTTLPLLYPKKVTQVKSGRQLNLTKSLEFFGLSSYDVKMNVREIYLVRESFSCKIIGMRKSKLEIIKVKTDIVL